ncbi:hypothetical protein [Caldimonas brevitalea]|uniref:Uncharacterized protein n=1 Tax=Caldimonas brevitalea TaxID=413882 RepID=A0A0G3BUR2_9BURK|nr:hypothetical protein [Caldimonas brevitalea]AKJ31758.1 hypothetical protein AAW51_5067 [Caldimonas brevitalea]
MQHADLAALRRLDSLLQALRGQAALVEKSAGCFYLKSKAFLHFHVEADDLYADVKLHGDSFSRCRITTPDEQTRLLAEIEARLQSGAPVPAAGAARRR